MTGAVNRKPPASMPDMELAALAALGDRRAFGELVRRHGASVRALVRRMGADSAAADDVAQDAFIAAFERINEFRGEGAFPAWVRRIAARLYIRRVRRRERVEFGGDAAAAALEAESGAAGEADAARRLDLDEALAALPAVERICVSLCYGAGFTHGEAAELVGAPLGTVKSHVRRGLERLRRRMEGPSDASPPRRRAEGEGKGEEHV